MKRFRLRKFIFDSSTYELTRDGQQVPLPRLPTKLLLFLLERSGQLVEQRTLVSELWPHADAADAIPNLHAAIKRIRTALGDSSTDPIYIQTVIGLGYRVIVPVEVESLQSSAPPNTGGAEPYPPVVPASLPEPLSSEAAHSGEAPGSESAASVSTTNLSAAKRPLQPAAWLLWSAAALLVAGSLVWIVYAVRASRSAYAGLNLTPFVRLTVNDTDNAVSVQAISPDGQKLVFADTDGLMIQGLHDSAPTRLLLAGLQEVNSLSWFPDGKRVAVSGLAKDTATPQIWIVTVDGSFGPALFRDHLPLAAVSLLSGRIAYLSGDSTEVWDSNGDGSSPRRILTAAPGKSFDRLTWMPNKPFLVVEEERPVSKQELEANPNATPSPADGTLLIVRARDGEITGRKAGYKLVEGCVLPKDRLIIGGLTMRSEQSVAVDPESAEAFKRDPVPLALPEDSSLYGCSVASNGNIAILLRKGQPSVFVGELSGDSRTLLHSHPITSGKLGSYPHGWFDSGRTVLYEQWHDRWELFRQPVDLHTPEPLRSPAIEGVGARRSPDGQWILFFRKDASGTFRLSHMPAGGTGTASELPVPSGDLRCPHRGTACVLLVKDTKAHFVALYALDPATGATHFRRTLPWSEASLTDWDVSPDGGSVVFCGATDSKGVLQIFDLHSEAERVERFPVNAAFRAVNWNSNGKGWFAVTYSKSDFYLYYAGVDHTVSLLRRAKYGTWGVPSPDGRLLAFIDLNQDKNVWLTHQSSGR